MKKYRTAAIAASIAILAAAGMLFLTYTKLPAASMHAVRQGAPNVQTAIARRGVFLERVTVQGRIGPPAGSGSKLAFSQAGILHSIDVEVGERVDTGQVLAEIDRTPLALAVTQAETEARSAQADASANHIAAESTARQAALKVSTDLATIMRDEMLLRAGVIAAKEVGAARSQLAADKAEQRSAAAKASIPTQAAPAAAKVATARFAYENGVMRAPSSGVVLAILKHPGEGVDTSTPVMEIGSPRVGKVTASVPADIARGIRVGAPAQIRIPQASGAYPSRVSAVVPTDDPATQAATVVLNGAPPDAVPGDAVTATIVIRRVTAILVPSSAIVQDPQTGKTLVFVLNEPLKSGEVAYSLREVRVRSSDALTAAVETGLLPGERVATSGTYDLLAPTGG
jgi:RND family efflux transporter MFP subunit